MIRTIIIGAFLLVAAMNVWFSPGQAPGSQNHLPCSQEHQEWVANTLEKMQSVKPGLTREALLKVFTTEGGLSTASHRTFVSRDCPYFKVDVEFQPMGRPGSDEDGRLTLQEDRRDIIVKISQPYLQFSITD